MLRQTSGKSARPKKNKPFTPFDMNTLLGQLKKLELSNELKAREPKFLLEKVGNAEIDGEETNNKALNNSPELKRKRRFEEIGPSKKASVETTEYTPSLNWSFNRT